MQVLPDGYVLRKIESSDYYKGYFGLLSQLTFAPDIPFGDFNEIVRAPNCEFVVVEFLPESKIVATVRINFERKLIRSGAKVCHLEDFVVDQDHRSQGLGKILIEHVKLRANQESCYKMLGNCSSEMVPYYEKNGFEIKSHVFSKYF